MTNFSFTGTMPAISGWALKIVALFLMMMPLQMVHGQDQVDVSVPPVSAAPAPAPETSGDSLNEGYILGAGDIVEVSVLGRAEYSARVQVQVDGTIQLPFLKSVPAANKTVVELREDVARRLKAGGFYTDPVVAVSVASYASRYVVVLGEVASPGLVPIDRAYRVSEILARVGGVRTSGADEVKLRRESGEELILNIRDVATGGDALDPFVKPGDKLYVDEAKRFYIYGQIAAPGTYPVDREMSLRKALARGGGLTDLGSDKRVKVFREGREIKKFDLSGIIQEGDVIVIGERYF